MDVNVEKKLSSLEILLSSLLNAKDINRKELRKELDNVINKSFGEEPESENLLKEVTDPTTYGKLQDMGLVD